MQLLSHDKGGDLAGEWGRDLGDPIAVVRLEPGELAKNRGIAFISGHDDLDSLLIALVKATSGREYALVRHDHAPSPGTQILSRTQVKDPKRVFVDLLELLTYLRVPIPAVTWTAPRIEAAWRHHSDKAQSHTVRRKVQRRRR
jgi:hypothetical protein